jgi:uncharacterized membrane protein
MPLIEESIEIDAARTDVFRFCHDLSHWPEWAEQIENAEFITPKPVRRGSLLRIDARQGRSAVFSWEAEVAEYQLPSASRVRAIDTARSSPFAAGSEMKWEFESTGRGTRFTWRWDYKPSGFFASILDALGRRSSTQKAIQRSLEKVKELLEAGRRARI